MEEIIEKMKIDHAKQMRFASIVRNMDYKQALEITNTYLDMKLMSAFDTSYVLACMFEMPKEKTLEDIISMRK